MDFSIHDSLILLLLRKAKNHSSIGLCFYYAFRKSDQSCNRKSSTKNSYCISCADVSNMWLLYFLNSREKEDLLQQNSEIRQKLQVKVDISAKNQLELISS